MKPLCAKKCTFASLADARAMSPLNDIDAELAALEARLAEMPSDDDDDDDDDGSDEERRRREKKKSKKESKKEKKKRRRQRESDDDADVLVGGDDLPRIEPLPASLLPEGNDYKGKGARGSFLGKAAKTAGAPPVAVTVAGGANTELARRLAARADRPRCEACGMDFTSDAQYEEHCRGKKHLKIVRAATFSARGPQGGSGAGAGGRRHVKPPPGPHCELCRKMFTSDAQRLEHLSGKWHKKRESGELPPSNKPYS